LGQRLVELGEFGPVLWSVCIQIDREDVVGDGDQLNGVDAGGHPFDLIVMGPVYTGFQACLEVIGLSFVVANVHSVSRHSDSINGVQKHLPSRGFRWARIERQ